jgi:hypothetical protein
MQARFCANYCARMSDIQVQHLIEKCICYKLNKEECMETLEKHAKIMPVVTSTGTRCNCKPRARVVVVVFFSIAFLVLLSCFPLRHYSCNRLTKIQE